MLRFLGRTHGERDRDRAPGRHAEAGVHGAELLPQHRHSDGGRRRGGGQGGDGAVRGERDFLLFVDELLLCFSPLGTLLT